MTKTTQKPYKGANNTYWGNLREGISSSWKGLAISLRHLWNARRRQLQVYVSDERYFTQPDGVVTLRYPLETLPTPDIGRYRLHNEMDDCIVCDKCAKICPVDCIEIEPIKATEQVGVTSDGSPIRLYAAKFDIDMAKCCYCGLCTTVCPTECLTMTKAYDYSEQSVSDLIYHFSNLSPEEAQEKMDLLALFQKEKEEAKARKTAEPSTTASAAAKPVAKPKAITPKTTENTEAAAKPVFKPKVKP
ncbi:4Fe-4S binding protein, partial [Eisenibacter elegans]|uniref:4Fe-4S binding protein n=1 Tax=Eisenibacter elegans TaxID=997 RepID=UPI0012B67092